MAKNHLSIRISSIFMVTLFLGISSLFAQQVETVQTKPSESRSPAIPGWWRFYEGNLTRNGPKLIGGGTGWAKPSQRWADYQNIWVEYVPVSGASLWVPSRVSYGGSTTEDPSPRVTGVVEPGSSDFVGPFRFVIEADIDGKGYRVWSKDRTRLLGEEFFGDIPDPLPIRLEIYRGDAFIIHADPTNPPIWGINARWSADGEHWSYTRGSVQGGLAGSGEGYEWWDRRIDSEVMEKNTNPIIEADIGIGLRRIIRRFEFGKSPFPISGSFSAREPVGEDEDRERVRKILDHKREVVMRRHRQEQLDKMPLAQRKVEEEKDRRDAEDKDRLKLLKERIEKEKM